MAFHRRSNDSTPTSKSRRIHRHLVTLCFLLNWSSFVWDKEQCDLFVFALPVIKKLWLTRSECVPASPTMILNHISFLELATECFFWCCCMVWTDSDSPADGASEPLNFVAVGSCGGPAAVRRSSPRKSEWQTNQLHTNDDQHTLWKVNAQSWIKKTTHTFLFWCIFN